jgi:hypothetical protein
VHNIIKSPRYEKELARLIQSCEQVEAFVFGVEWVLSHDPTSGTKLPVDNVWCISVNPTPKLPSATVYYTFGKTYVVLVSIAIIERNGDGRH